MPKNSLMPFCAYEAVVKTDEITALDDRLSRLETQRRTLEEQMRRQRVQIRERVDEYGTQELTGRQEIALQQVATLQREQVSIGVQRMLMEARVMTREDQLQDELTLADIADQVQARVESDPDILALRQDIQRYNQLIRDGQATMLETNPEMQRRKQILSELQAELERQRADATARHEQTALADARRVREAELDALKAELNQLITYEEKIQEQLKLHDDSTVRIGRTQLDIDDLREQFENTRQIYNEISRRIEELNIERDRRPRISVASWARSVSAGKKEIGDGGVRRFAMGVRWRCCWPSWIARFWRGSGGQTHRRAHHRHHDRAGSRQPKDAGPSTDGRLSDHSRLISACSTATAANCWSSPVGWATARRRWR